MTISTVRVLSVQLVAKEVSAEKPTCHYLSRIKTGAYLSAFTRVDAEATLVQTRAADACIAAGNAAPLTSVPIVYKDVLVTYGWCVTTGSKTLGNYVNPFDTTAVERLGTVGMVTLGKTDMDEFAMGSSNENLAFDVVKNPWNLEHVPGDLSGGSAIAVAADLASAATGTDIGGSTRQLVSPSGITGAKPTYGRVSCHGMVTFALLLGQGGPMARTAEDCALLLSAMTDSDPRDSTSLEPGRGGDVEDLGRLLDQPLQGTDVARPLAGLRIDLSKGHLGEGLADDMRTTVRAMLAELEKLGAALVDINLLKTKLSIPTYYVIAPTEASSNLSRFDSMRYGHHAAEYHDLTDIYRKPRAEDFGQEVKCRVLVGAYVLSYGHYGTYHLRAQKIRRIIAQDLQDVLAGTNHQCDVIMDPVAPTIAWKLSKKASDPVQICLVGTFVLSISLASLPGMSVPAGFGANGLPVGLQTIGSYFEEARMLQTAHTSQQAADQHHRQLAV